MTKRQELIDFLDSIRDYERESHNMIGFDERTSRELVDQYLADHPKSEMERSCDNCIDTFTDHNKEPCKSCDVTFSNWKPQI